jgi:endonuclease YncB( thermonuclease family)
MRSVVLCAALVLFVCGAPHAAGDERDFTGVVAKVFDGDSFLVRPATGEDVDVRLIDVDAPEKTQPHADEARAALIRLIGARRVFVDVMDVDRYNRKVARVYREPDRLDVGRSLVHDGHVWVYRRAARDRSLIRLEDAARAARVGLWSSPEQDLVPPWRFRYMERDRKSGVTAKNAKNAKNRSSTGDDP